MHRAGAEGTAVLKSLELNEKITEQGVILNIGGHYVCALRFH